MGIYSTSPGSPGHLKGIDVVLGITRDFGPRLLEQLSLGSRDRIRVLSDGAQAS